MSWNLTPTDLAYWVNEVIDEKQQWLNEGGENGEAQRNIALMSYLKHESVWSRAHSIATKALPDPGKQWYTFQNTKTFMLEPSEEDDVLTGSLERDHQAAIDVLREDQLTSRRVTGQAFADARRWAQNARDDKLEPPRTRGHNSVEALAGYQPVHTNETKSKLVSNLIHISITIIFHLDGTTSSITNNITINIS